MIFCKMKIQLSANGGKLINRKYCKILRKNLKAILKQTVKLSISMLTHNIYSKYILITTYMNM